MFTKLNISADHSFCVIKWSELVLFIYELLRLLTEKPSHKWFFLSVIIPLKVAPLAPYSAARFHPI